METLTLDYLAAFMTGVELPDFADFIDRPAWMADAACREHPEVEYFPGQGTDVRPAIEVCHACDVREQCLAFALADPLIHGIWGGTSVKERRRLRRTRLSP